jgi:opacity protein-like surface antigen
VHAQEPSEIRPIARGIHVALLCATSNGSVLFMRKVLMFAAFVFCAAPAAHAQSLAPTPAPAPALKTEVQGFGGITVGTSAFGSAAAPSFGGRVNVDLLPNLQAVGEFGRLADLQSSLFNLLDYTGVGVHLNAWYGEGGVRFIAAPRSAVRPYAETTFGFAKLSTTISGLSGTSNAIADAGLVFLNRSEPVLGVGAGIEFRRGPVALDMGYRFKKISTGNLVSEALNGGSDFKVNQFRIGVGVRF